MLSLVCVSVLSAASNIVIISMTEREREREREREGGVLLYVNGFVVFYVLLRLSVFWFRVLTTIFVLTSCFNNYLCSGFVF